MDAAPPVLFDVRLVRHRAWCSVTVRGELDLAAADVLRARCTGIGDVVVVVDLARLTFIDCAGYRALTDVIESVDVRGRRSMLVGARGPVARFLQLVGHEYPAADLLIGFSWKGTPHSRHHRQRPPMRSATIFDTPT